MLPIKVKRCCCGCGFVAAAIQSFNRPYTTPVLDTVTSKKTLEVQSLKTLKDVRERWTCKHVLIQSSNGQSTAGTQRGGKEGFTEGAISYRFRWDHEGGALPMGLVSFSEEKEIPEHSLSTMWRHNDKAPIYKPGRKVSPGNESPCN